MSDGTKHAGLAKTDVSKVDWSKVTVATYPVRNRTESETSFKPSVKILPLWELTNPGTCTSTLVMSLVKAAESDKKVVMVDSSWAYACASPRETKRSSWLKPRNFPTMIP